MRITSRQNQRVKDAARLRLARERQRSGRFVIDGGREISRAVAAGVHCIEAFICEELCQSAESRQAIDGIRKAGVEMFDVTPDVFAKLAFGDRNEGIVAMAKAPHRTLDDLRLPPNPLVAVLDNLEKPGNVGAILRSADAAGVDAVIVADGRTDLYNPNTIRASLGTVFRDNVCSATRAAALDWLRQQGVAVVAARPDAVLAYSDFDFTSGTAIVLGSEAHGLAGGWDGANVTAVRLPMLGVADSLNVSTAAAVLFYEAMRQRTAGRRR